MFLTGIVVDIVESYRDWAPPIDVNRVVSRLLSDTASRYQIGLASVVLTNASGLSHDRRREKTRHRGRKVGIAEIRGAYHQKWQGDPAWVEVFVDNTLNGIPLWLLRLPILQDAIVADVLFHEIGHHLHATQAPEHREPEDVAERWERRLWRQYARRHYWYLLPWFYPIHLGVRLWNKVRK
ncbi:MAG: hypothetical protein WBG00_19915 [Thermoanaerobaculia bacterium]